MATARFNFLFNGQNFFHNDSLLPLVLGLTLAMDTGKHFFLKCYYDQIFAP